MRPRVLKNRIIKDKPKADSHAANAKINKAKIWHVVFNVKKDTRTNENDKHKNIISIETKVLNKFFTPTIMPKYDKKIPLKLVKNDGKLKKLTQKLVKKSNIF